MKNILYITYVDFFQGAFPGVEAKIDGHIKSMAAAGYHVDRITQYGNAAQLVDMESGKTELFQAVVSQRFSLLKAVKAALARRHYAAAYIRFQFFSEDVRRMVLCLKKSGAKVLMEIPTFPYEGELHQQGPKGELKLLCDRMFRRACAQNIDVFITVGEGENRIYGTPCIRILNGLDYQKHPLRHVRPGRPNEVHLLAVASMLPWHGYDRVLNGLAHYYKNSGQTNFVLHLVGEGRESAKYRQLVAEHQLDSHVIFHGMKGGSELNSIADECDVAIGSLAAFRIGITKMSTLKSREYCAWGFPTVNATPTDILDADDPFCLFVPEDESAVDMEAVAAFYQRVYFESGLTAEQIAHAIREKARNRSDVDIVFQPVLDYIRNGNQS